MHPLKPPYNVSMFGTNGWQLEPHATVKHQNMNHYTVVLDGIPIWMRLDTLDNVPLMINGISAIRVLGSNLQCSSGSTGTLTLQVLLPV